MGAGRDFETHFEWPNAVSKCLLCDMYVQFPNKEILHTENIVIEMTPVRNVYVFA